MSFSLSFSEEFFSLPGELYDGAEYPHGDTPYSVIGAIRAMDETEYDEMCREVFKCEGEYVSAEMVLDRICVIYTCRDLTSPVEVYIDTEGWFSVFVHARGDRPEM